MHITILGLGLIGSSVARACKQFMAGCTIFAYDTNPLALQYATQQGFVDHVYSDAAAACGAANIIILAAPPSASIALIAEIAPSIAANCLVMDVASVKAPIAQAMREHIPAHALFMPAHPIAGSEQVGVAAGKADLFAGKRLILTPDSPEDPAIAKAADFWSRLGTNVEYMPADVHDLVYAYVSHLPQLLAFAIKPVIESLELSTTQPQYFKSFTRLCGSDRRLWDDIFTTNKTYLDEALARYLVMFSVIRKELGEGGVEHAEKSPKEPISREYLWVELLPRVIASCLIGTIAQENSRAGFNFARFAGSGFIDFTAPLKDAPDKHLEDISNFSKQVVEAMDELIASLAEWVVIKSS